MTFSKSGKSPHIVAAMPDKSGVFTGISETDASETNFYRRPVSWRLLCLQVLCIQLRKIEKLNVTFVWFLDRAFS